MRCTGARGRVDSRAAAVPAARHRDQLRVRVTAREKQRSTANSHCSVAQHAAVHETHQIVTATSRCSVASETKKEGLG